MLHIESGSNTDTLDRDINTQPSPQKRVCKCHCQLNNCSTWIYHYDIVCGASIYVISRIAAVIWNFQPMSCKPKWWEKNSHYSSGMYFVTIEMTHHAYSYTWLSISIPIWIRIWICSSHHFHRSSFFVNDFSSQITVQNAFNRFWVMYVL